MAGRCGCQRSCTCCVQESDTITTPGSGSAGECWSPAVRISGDDGNRAEARADGIFAGLCAVGPDGEPLGTTEEGCLEIPAPCILDYNSDPIEPDENGCIQLPTNGAPPDFGCGLETDGGGALQVHTSGAWPLTSLLAAPFAGAYTGGSAIFCGPDGALRGAPQGTAVTAGASTIVEPTALIPVAGIYTTAASPAVLLVNPSPARSMIAARFIVAIVDVVATPDADFVLRLQARIDGGGWGTARDVIAPAIQSGSASIRSRLELSTWNTTVLAAGAAHTVELRVQVEKTGAGAGTPVLISATVGSRIVGVSQ